MILTSVALFCGSSPGFDMKYVHLARAFGEKCAELRLNLIYGGASLGLMGEAANAALMGEGKVTGVFPSFFSIAEVAHRELSEMIEVESMSERKQLLEKSADAFVILPGSYGTMDEMFEVLTDAQLGFHRKPIGIINAFGYYDGLLLQLKHCLKEGFLKKCHYDLLIVAGNVEELFRKFSDYEYPNDLDWLAKVKR